MAKAREHLLAIHAALANLDGDLSLKPIVVTHGKVDRAHAAASILAKDAIGAEAFACHRLRIEQQDALSRTTVAIASSLPSASRNITMSREF